MKSPRISVFCLLDELMALLEKICQRFGLSMLVYRGEKYEHAELIAPVDCLAGGTVKRAFLFPASEPLPSSLAFNNINPVENGWIDVSPGGLVELGEEHIVLLTDIAVTKVAGPDQRTWKAILAMKRELKQSAKKGVLGRNVVTGGESFYNNMWYTDKALELFIAGAGWKQYLEMRSVFEPAT